jgi:hypothetical protein
MIEWLIGIEGNISDIAILGTELRSNDLKIIKDEGKDYLSYSGFSSVTDAKVVYTQATELIKVINGAAKLSFPNIKIISQSGVIKSIERNENGDLKGGGTHIFPPPMEVRSFMTATVRIGDKVLPTAVDEWTALSKEDDKVRKAFVLFGNNDHSWDNLFKIFEIIESDVGGKMISNGWITKSQKEKFTNTANSSTALGIEARHGHSKHAAPKKPMTKAEAIDIISTLLKRWLRQKADTKMKD